LRQFESQVPRHKPAVRLGHELKIQPTLPLAGFVGQHSVRISSGVLKSLQNPMQKVGAAVLSWSTGFSTFPILLKSGLRTSLQSSIALLGFEAKVQNWQLSGAGPTHRIWSQLTHS
jgi:hypothetical protein